MEAKAREFFSPLQRKSLNHTRKIGCTGYVRRVTHNEIADAVG
jgi:hypothetical protein